MDEEFESESDSTEEVENAEESKPTGYFADYSNIDVHKIMLNDHVRTGTYYNAIMSQKEYFKDKIVMDVGCGTGILSLFCAKAGAKKVYAVDGSLITELATDVVKENNMEDVIEVIHCVVENVTLPDNIKVDVIVSEWMGFYLLHEGMLDSVICARDKFLKEDGKMFPEHAYLYVAPCSIPSLFDKWDDFYGFSMAPFAKKLVMKGNKRPEIHTIREEQLIGPASELASFNLKTVTCEVLNSVTLKTVVPASREGKHQGLCVWWKCVFPTTLEDGSKLVLSTSPSDPTTHWEQCILMLPYGIEVEEDQPIAFDLTIYRDDDDLRRYKIAYDMVDPDAIEHPAPCNCYKTKCILAKAFLAQVENNEIKDSGNCVKEDETTEEMITETSSGNK